MRACYVHTQTLSPSQAHSPLRIAQSYWSPNQLQKTAELIITGTVVCESYSDRDSNGTTQDYSSPTKGGQGRLIYAGSSLIFAPILALIGQLCATPTGYNQVFFLHFFLGKRGTGSDTHFWEPINISFFRAKLRVDLTCVFPTHVLSVFLSLSSSSSLFLGVTFLLSFLPVTNVCKRFDLFVFPLLCFVPSFFIAVLHVIHFITFFFLSLSFSIIASTSPLYFSCDKYKPMLSFSLFAL